MAGRPSVYPRVCGGTPEQPAEEPPPGGLSPRVRGNLAVIIRYPPGVRSIPACAGEPPYLPPRRAPVPVYPRVCGGTSAGPPIPCPDEGLSPRVRGNHHCWRLPIPLTGSIPACAGEPAPPPASLPRQRVYPRVCGGTLREMDDLAERQGLSPRVRGNPAGAAHQAATPRSIPACAGEPAACTASNSSRMVYPRVCGGTKFRLRRRLPGRGLSPRVRGNPVGDLVVSYRVGSIPACAGEPPTPSANTGQAAVYPRVCGGTAQGYAGALVTVRSIPACAGEPRCMGCAWRCGPVYPRVCGGTRVGGQDDRPARGLSPRVRGNRR